MTNYQVTIGYKAVIVVDIKAEDEKTAKEQAVKLMTKQRDKMFTKQNFTLQDDTYRADGILDMDETWNAL